MSEAKKPWEETGWWANSCAVWHANGDLIAEVNMRVDAAHDADAQERARLMAAAPDLYRALREVADFYESEKLPGWESWLRRAQLALAKARGE